MKRWVWLVALVFLLAGCTDGGGDADDDPNGDGDGSQDDGDGEDLAPADPPTVDLEIAATGAFPVDFGYDVERLEAPAGSVVDLTFSNDDANPLTNHDWYLEALGAQTPTLAPGESETVRFSVDLEPGEYPFWCTIGNHRDQGMEGVFVVTASE